jgi:hypothetical protein
MLGGSDERSQGRPGNRDKEVTSGCPCPTSVTPDAVLTAIIRSQVDRDARATTGRTYRISPLLPPGLTASPGAYDAIPGCSGGPRLLSGARTEEATTHSAGYADHVAFAAPSFSCDHCLLPPPKTPCRSTGEELDEHPARRWSGVVGGVRPTLAPSAPLPPGRDSPHCEPASEPTRLCFKPVASVNCPFDAPQLPSAPGGPACQTRARVRITHVRITHYSGVPRVRGGGRSGAAPLNPQLPSLQNRRQDRCVVAENARPVPMPSRRLRPAGRRLTDVQRRATTRGEHAASERVSLGQSLLDARVLASARHANCRDASLLPHAIEVKHSPLAG